MEFKDYYKILGVPRSASAADIKKAYRTQARLHHPDANSGNKGSDARFKEINEANAVLSDPKRRAAYDALGPDWASGQAGTQAGRARPSQARPAGPAGSSGTTYRFVTSDDDPDDFSDFFRAIFGQDAGFAAGPGQSSARQSARARGQTLEDLLHASDAFGPASRPPSNSNPGDQRRQAAATGELDISLLEAYTGTRRLLAVGDRHFEVVVPAGVADGARLRLAGVAAGGDAYLTIHVKAHPDFARQGADLARELPITLGEALLGAEVTVPTLRGGKLALRLPPETQNGRVFRLRGQGMPRMGSAGFGDLLVKIRVVLPSRLDEGSVRSARAFVKRLAQPSPRPGDPIKTPPRRRPSEMPEARSSQDGSR